MKRCFVLLRFPEIEPHHQMQFSVTPKTFLLLYTHLPYHNDSIIVKTDTHRKTHEERKQEETTQEDFFNNIYLPLTLLQGFGRVVQGLHVSGCWRPNINFIF